MSQGFLWIVLSLQLIISLGLSEACELPQGDEGKKHNGWLD